MLSRRYYLELCWGLFWVMVLNLQFSNPDADHRNPPAIVEEWAAPLDLETLYIYPNESQASCRRPKHRE